MKKSVIAISLFLLGTTLVKAQEMTPKEKHSYAIGVMIGEKIKSSGIDTSVIDSINSIIDIDFESIKKGIHDDVKGESKLSKEEIATILVELKKKKEYLDKIMNANQSKGNETEKGKSLMTTKGYNYGNLSWNYLFIEDYVQSEQSARQALALDSTQTWVKTNLAHALLFQNRFSEAEKIYKELSQLIIKDNETYTKTILGDFEELEKAGVIPEERKADVEKIRKMLQE